MGFTSKVWLFIALLAAAFAGGYWLRGPAGDSSKSAVRKPLYWHDPMHPAYKSDKPGIAPDCGMQLEPVYADGAAVMGDSVAAVPPGAVRISLEKQQVMGLRTAVVAQSSERSSLRVLGRVATDETRVYRVTALADGVVRKVSAFAPGNIVHKDDFLASYFVAAPEIFNAIQGYFVAYNNFDAGLAATGQGNNGNAQTRLAEELLKTYGFTEAQLRELARTRQPTRDIEFRAPVNGLVLARDAALGQRAEKGKELFRIADLSKVWVLADVFENDSGLVRAGAAARVYYRGRTFHSAVTNSLPQFDPASRTLRVRLELDNADFVLRPDMFVDVEFDIKEPKGISVPFEALLDSGRRKTVFVSTGEGVFEAREVTTGSRFGDRVEIASGLAEGDRVVVSGMFLLDSESRLQMSAAASTKLPMAAEAVTDPVCGMEVDASKTAHQSEYEGATYRFCSKSCKDKFDANQARYAAKKGTASRKAGQS